MAEALISEQRFPPILTLGLKPDVESRDVPCICIISPPVTVRLLDLTDVMVGFKLPLYSNASGMVNVSSRMVTYVVK